MEKPRFGPQSRDRNSYLIVCTLSLLVLALVMQLWRADWRVPFCYSGDAVFNSAFIKSICDNGWYLRNDLIGMPWGATMHDFPLPEIWHWFIIKLATLFVSDHALILNLFFVATFPLTALMAFFVFRQFQVSALPAMLGSLLYTFLPYHFYRGESHFMLASYYTVPLIVLVLLWVCAGGTDESASDRLQSSFRNRRLICSIGICVLVGSSGVYYAFFTCCLLVVSGALVAVSRKNLRGLLLPGVLAGVVFVTLLVCLSPNIVYFAGHGRTTAVQRHAGEAEFYGLKIAQMLLPVRRHRLDAMAQIKHRYNNDCTLLVNENDDSSLGIIGSLGFLTLVGWLLARVAGGIRPQAGRTDRLLDHLSVLNLSAVLLGTIGGFGVLFALLASPLIRSYNRISVFIAFFSLFAVVLLLDRAFRRWFDSGLRRMVFVLGVALLAVAGMLDQTCSRFVPSYESDKTIYRNDADFVQQIERALPPGAMVFQLPIARFPEPECSGRIGYLDQLKGYLHSQHLRWSYGASRDRASDLCQQAWASKPLPQMIETMALTGFRGLYVDRFGYTNNAVALEADLSVVLGSGPLIVSADGRLSFFDLKACEQRLRERYPAQELEARRQRALHPPVFRWQGGFFPLDNAANKSWRWCSHTGELQVENPIHKSRHITLKMSFSAENPGNLKIESPFFSEGFKVGSEPAPFSKTVVVPPGVHTIRFSCDAPRVNERCDPRVMVFKVRDFHWHEAD